jgi:polysaccharide biosynthesis protein PelA
MSHLQNLDSYAGYYGSGRLDELTKFPLVILQPDHYQPTEIEALRAKGTLTLSYLSLGEDNTLVEGAPWYMRTAAGDPRINPDWQTYYIDTRHPAWRQHVLSTRIPAILAQSRFDGLFLDTLDSQDLFPEIRGGTISLVHAIRAAYPNAILVANRGFTLLEQIAADLDGVMFESFSTYYRAGHYHNWDTLDRENNERLADWINRLRLTYPLTLFALDYALPHEKERIEYAVRRARVHGFIPYVTTANLSQLYYLPGTM